MKSIIKFSLNNKFALWILTAIIMFAGLYSGLNMKMETMPDITVPIVSVTTVYPGAAPEEIMEKVTKPIEQRTRNMQGVKTVNSTSMENASSIIVEYEYGVDMDAAATEIKEAVAGLDLPEGAQSPSVSRISLNAFPVLALSLSNDKMDLEQLTKDVEQNIVPEIEGIEGVASVQISGQNVKQAELTFKPEQLAKYGLTEETVKGIIQGNALSVPLGIFEFGSSEKTVLVDGNIVTEEDLNNLQIPYTPQGAGGGAGAGAGAPAGGAQGGALPEGVALDIKLPTVSLSEVADLKVIDKAESISRTNGELSIGISIVKSADANTVDVVNGVKNKMTDLEKNTDGLKVITSLDQGKPIEDSVHTMISKAIIGAIIAVFIILIFLRNIRSTIIAVVSIPLSILIALLVLSRFDVTLNIMTLGAMTVAIGRVIDDSIVVIENIYRRMALTGEKLKGKELILDATKEMFVPIMSSTIVTIAVFLPLALVSGMIGEIFMPFALTIVFALLASLLVAITVVPMLAHMMFRNGIKAGKVHEEKPGRLTEWYKGSLKWSLNHKFIAFGIALVLLIGSCFLLPVIGMSFLPGDEEKTMVVTYNPAPGETREQVEEMSLKAEGQLLNREGLEIVQYSVGGGNPFNPAASKQALFNLKYEESFKEFAGEKDQVIDMLQKLGGKGEWKQQDFMGGGIGGSKVSMVVYGPDMKSLQPVVEELQNKLKENKDLTNVDTSLSETYEQYRIVADQEKLSQNGLAAGQIAMALSPSRSNPVLTKIEKDGKELNVYVKVEQKVYKDKADLENVKLTSPLGKEIALKDVAVIEEGASPNTITRKNDRIYAEVSADITASNVGGVSTQLKTMTDEMKLPSGMDIEMGGVTEQMTESFMQLGLAMLAAIAIVYLVLVITFGGALTPFAILFSLPFTVIGAFVGLWIAGESLSITAMIGALMLIGIVVTNAIVLVDRVIHKERDGLSVREALLEAGGTRLRPILMTAIATVGALLPLALGFESGGLISKGMAITVIGGLTSSTLLTLFIVPIVYEFLNRKRKTAQ
ncbi:efflux RND transporter permease subunit [Paenibacillus radicis (ex Gao et al. 2016)]|uniref:Swarming motility protein SwrC n=1 Tax=Paenibacillus radicis (ex Gao et al. 2016) TaxID=1737354 RepID=A0A917HHX7_9BACL|nr:efflux RND transporter permease subunit [Paenibacillus radicis (ex Gao et al. 2016)]GGG80136.1 swarming motility protein SwrC [Paenibacillus radicis (ex Gao et al. 2016)]